MSAECNRHGCDLAFDLSCRECELEAKLEFVERLNRQAEAELAQLRAERAGLRAEVERLRDAIREIAAAGFDSTRNEIAREALDRMKP